MPELGVHVFPCFVSFSVGLMNEWGRGEGTLSCIDLEVYFSKDDQEIHFATNQ